jgi:hypothetical protein
MKIFTNCFAQLRRFSQLDENAVAEDKQHETRAAPIMPRAVSIADRSCCLRDTKAVRPA